VRSLKGKIIVLTGASSGIGRATALALAREGAELHLIARRAQLLEEVCGEVRALGGMATPHVLDVRDTNAVMQLAEHLRVVHGRIDVLINNAGVGAIRKFLETTDDDWKWTFDVNLHSVIGCIRAFLPMMLSHGGGTIVNIASVAGITGNILAAYTASKFAVVGLSESLLLEYGKQGLKVVVVCPGIINTDMASTAIDAGRTDPSLGPLMQRVMRERGVSPDVVARDIVKAIRRPRFLVLTPMHAVVMKVIHQFLPGLWRTMSSRMIQQ
jgi:NAD(P)-dependent dehydrogenase (short-subunit alcohol dehydrogenase family)